MEVSNCEEKNDVFKHCSELKGSRISVSNDYSQITIHKRKMLWESAKEEKAQGSRVKLVHDRLRVDDDTWYGMIRKCHAKIRESLASHNPTA